MGTTEAGTTGPLLLPSSLSTARASATAALPGDRRRGVRRGPEPVMTSSGCRDRHPDPLRSRETPASRRESARSKRSWLDSAPARASYAATSRHPATSSGPPAEVGELDVLVNNAGVTAFEPLVDRALEDFERVMDVNVRGVFLMTRATRAAPSSR